MTTTRTDVFRPSAIDPADFVFVDVIDLNESLFPGQGDLLEAVQNNTDRPRTHVSQCDHCGAAIRYACIHTHLPTGKPVVFGQICADETLGLDSRRSLEMKRAKEAAAARRKSEKQEAERQEKLAEVKATFPEAFDILNGYDGDNEFIADVAGRFTRLGYVSEKQAAAVVRAHARDEARRKAREAEIEIPVPEGRQTVEGEVIKTEERIDEFASGYGRTVYKLVWTVKDARGFLVWGTVPAKIASKIEKGSKVRFAANLERSDRDEHFGFAKRPSKAEVLS